MFPPRRAHTALAAAAGLTGIATSTPAEAGPSPRAVPPPAADSPSGSYIATRLASLPVRALERLVEDAEAQQPRRARRGFVSLRVRRGGRVALRARPAGRIVARVGDRTEFGSRRTFSVVERRGRWLGVTTTRRGGGRAWIDGRSGKLARVRTRVSVRVDLSRGRVELRSGRRTLRSAPVALGAPGSPTPVGRFAVTDKLGGARYGGVYGCCVIALNGRQTRLPPGWRGGDRLAIHGGPRGSRGSTAGCVRADARMLRSIMRRAPLGAPVSVVR